MTVPFRATLRQHYRLTDVDLLVLSEDYEGDVGPGDQLQIEVGDTHAPFVVQDLAWGSALSALRPPLSLVVKGLEALEPQAGASISTIEVE